MIKVQINKGEYLLWRRKAHCLFSSHRMRKVMSVVHKIRSGVKRKCSDHDDTLSRSGLESKSSPHKSLFLIHAIFTSVVRERLMN